MEIKWSGVLRQTPARRHFCKRNGIQKVAVFVFLEVIAVLPTVRLGNSK